MSQHLKVAVISHVIFRSVLAVKIDFISKVTERFGRDPDDGKDCRQKENRGSGG